MCVCKRKGEGGGDTRTLLKVDRADIAGCDDHHEAPSRVAQGRRATPLRGRGLRHDRGGDGGGAVGPGDRHFLRGAR